MLSNLVKKPESIIGIDCSTKTLAYAKFVDGEFVNCGELFFPVNKPLWERLSFAHDMIPPLVESGLLKADLIVFEGAILVGNNAKVGISLAYVYGAAIGALMADGTSVSTVAPLTWQSFIGNPNLTPKEKAQMKKDFPDKSKSWYSAKGREIRKQRSLDFARKYAKIDTDSDNVGDAVGVAYYATKNYHKLEYKR